jgi:hypothetical protein
MPKLDDTPIGGQVTEEITRDNLPRVGDLIVSNMGNLTLVLTEPIRQDLEGVEVYECQAWYLTVTKKRDNHFGRAAFNMDGTGWQIFSRA